MQDLQTKLQDAARRWRRSKVTKRDLVVSNTRHHRARLLKYYPRRPCAPGFVKSRTLRPIQTHFLLFQQQIFFVLVCIHPRTSRVPPRVLASGPKPCGGNNTKICFRNYWIQRQDSKPSADNNTRYSPAKSISECIEFTKRVEL